MRARLRALALVAAAFSSLGQARPGVQGQELLVRARQHYNAREFDAAIEAASEARKVPALANAAAVIFARAHLERYRTGLAPDGLVDAREALKQVYATSLSARDQVEFLIALGEALYLDGCDGGCYSAAAEMFDEALSRASALDSVERDALFEWWAAALERVAQAAPAADRKPIYGRILARADLELARPDPSPSASYWLAVAARGSGDYERAWGGAIAGYIRSKHLGPRGTKLRDDLDRFVTGILMPERARALTPEGDAKPLLAELLAQWEDVKKKWQ
jgi:hypothetical protein